MNRVNLYEDGKCIYTNLNYPPFTKIEDIEEQKNNYFNAKKKLLSHLNLCDYDDDSLFKSIKFVTFCSSKISSYPNIDSLSEQDVDNKIIDLIKNKFHSEIPGQFNAFCKYISIPYGNKYDDIVFNEFIRDQSFNNMSRVKELIINDIRDNLNKIIPDELKICLNDLIFLIPYSSPFVSFDYWHFLFMMELYYIDVNLNVDQKNSCSKCFNLKLYCETREKVKDLIPKYIEQYRSTHGIRGFFNKCISYFYGNSNKYNGNNKIKTE